MQAGKDEVVPAEHAEELEALALELGMNARRVVVDGALHNAIMASGAGRRILANFVRESMKPR